MNQASSNKLVDLSEIRGNVLNISELTQLYSTSIRGNLTLRYVTSGLEHYTINNSRYHIEPGQYLITNRHSKGSVLIDSKLPVKGICIDLSQEVLSEVFSNLTEPGAFELVNDLEESFYSPEFLENKYNAENTHAGGFLEQVNKSVFGYGCDASNITIDFFYSLCERVVADYIPLQGQMRKIKGIKSETRKELLRRLTKGKQLLDDTFLDNPSISFISQECGISQYHFFRLFKNTYGKSPNQYLIHKRLHFARIALTKKQHSVSDLALICGYSDIHSFSKSFKKYFGVNPSHLKK